MNKKTETGDRTGSRMLGTSVSRKPLWLTVKIPSGETYARVKKLVEGGKLHTVCEEARCPNMGECWNRGTATFLILGDACTRGCGFCAVKQGRPAESDPEEPKRVGETVALLGIRYAVVTSVTRDDLDDGGASVFAETIGQIRNASPGTKVEVLVPDFRGEESALKTVLHAFPDVLNHNIETVPRLYPAVRPQADYPRSLELLERAKKFGCVTKSGMMLGIGEKTEEVIDVMRELRRIDCDILTVGQYLRPSTRHLPVERYLHPDEFAALKKIGESMGFRNIESAPLVRSSYHAEGQAR